MLSLEHFGVTDAGKVRQNNEDALLVGDGRDPTLLVVADGIGGFEAGEVASSITVEVLKTLEPDESFEEAIQEANRRILAAARDDEKLSGMGTTIVAVRFTEEPGGSEAEVAHVGDSRAYLLRGEELRYLTEDHSLVSELIRSGELTRAEAAGHPQKNLITRALGAAEEIQVDTATLDVEAGDRLLLCSDGLSDMVPEDRIQRILAEPSGDPETAARRLLSAALDAGGSDNVTAVVADVKEHEAPEGHDGESPIEEVSGDTQEFRVASPERVAPQVGDQGGRRGGERRDPWNTTDPSRENRSGRVEEWEPEREPIRKRRRRRDLRSLAWLMRTIAALVVVAALLSPVYFWASTRYFLGYDNSTVVAYQGLPYNIQKLRLNVEYKRTSLKEKQVAEPYQAQIRDHKLYTKKDVDKVLGSLRSR